MAMICYDYEWLPMDVFFAGLIKDGKTINVMEMFWGWNEIYNQADDVWMFNKIYTPKEQVALVNGSTRLPG